MNTLKDVAKHLGISVSTVSRVINNSEHVDPKTRELVEAGIKELNYFPNENARRLKSNSSNVLGIIIPDITNPFFSNIVRGIEKTSAENNFSVILADTNGNMNNEKGMLNLLRRQQVAGIVCASVADDEFAKNIYASKNLNIVFVDNLPSIAKEYSSVIINNYIAAKELTELLIKKGHRKICMISGPLPESTAIERLEGFKAALKENGIEINDDHIVYGDYRLESGKQIMKQFLDANISPTAVFAANNFMAYGAMHTILESGLKVPGDIEIATFDIVDYTGLVKDKFINVSQPAFDIGRIAADICINQYYKRSVKNNNRIILDHHIE